MKLGQGQDSGPGLGLNARFHATGNLLHIQNYNTIHAHGETVVLDRRQKVPATTIPNPLQTGTYTLNGGSYTGAAGNTAVADQPTLRLEHHAVANVTVNGTGEPPPASAMPHYATFDAYGHDTLNLSLGGGRGSPLGPGLATVNLEPGARLSGSVATDVDGFLKVKGAPGASLVNYSGDLDGGAADIQADIRGSGTIEARGAGPTDGAVLSLDGAVSRGETVRITGGNVNLYQPMRFAGLID